MRVPLRERKQLWKAVWPIVAETVNMIDGFEDDEEEQFLKANADLIPLCSVDVAFLVVEYGADKPTTFLTGVEAAKSLGGRTINLGGVCSGR